MLCFDVLCFLLLYYNTKKIDFDFLAEVVLLLFVGWWLCVAGCFGGGFAVVVCFLVGCLLFNV